MAKRLISILAVICVFIMIAMPVNTEASTGNAIMPMYTDTSKISCDLSISGDTATVVASVRGKASTVKSCSLKVELQEKVGILWITKSTWDVSEAGNELSITRSCKVSSGKTYCVKATSTVYAATGSETQVYHRYSDVSNVTRIYVCNLLWN